MKNYKNACATGLLLLTQSAMANNTQVNPAEEMLNYFASTCPSQGAWTKAALGKASALVATLEAIAKTPECNSFIGSTGRLNLLESQVSSIASMNSTTEELFRERSIEQKILFMMTNTTDAGQLVSLRSKLVEVQLSITGLETDQRSRNSISAEHESEVLSNIASSTNDFLTHASNNQACLLKNSSLLADIAKLSGGVVSTLSAVNPALSLGIAGGTQLLSKMLEAAQNYKLNRKIRKLNQASDIAAMSCVLESLSTSYCNADDAMRAIDWKNTNAAAIPDAADGTLRSAVHLMDREAPAFLEWLEAVRTSALVSTLADGERVKDFFARDALLQGTLPVARGLFTQNAKILNSLPVTADPVTDELQHFTALKTILSKLMSQVGGKSPESDFYPSSSSTATNPIFSVYPQEVGLYFLLGIRQDQIPKTAVGPIPFSSFSISQWPPGIPKPVYDGQLLNAILARLTVWVQDASSRLGAERLTIVNPDGLNTLTDCDVKNYGPEHIAPCAAITKFRKFLDLRLADPQMTTTSFRRLYTDTRNRLQKIEDLMAALNQNADPTDAQLEVVLGQIYAIAQLNYGSFFLKGRVDSVMRIAFTDLFDRQIPSDAGVAAQSLASHRFLDALQRVKIGEGLRLVRQDIGTSMTLSQTTLDKFTEVFGEQIADVLQYLKESEEKNRPAITSTQDMNKSLSYRDERAKICLNLLNATAWPKQVDNRLCDGVNVQPLPPRGPVSTTVNLSLINSRPEQRMCRMRDIERSSDIFEFQQKQH